MGELPLFSVSFFVLYTEKCKRSLLTITRILADVEKDNVHLIADESPIGSSLLADMIILDTTAESSQEEIDGSSYGE